MKFNINIPDGAKFLIHTLQDNGYSAYVVGGCVRDSILGREPHDWDICTSATPKQMLKVFSDEQVIETGLKHGTITVVINKTPYEITTYRIDGNYSDNRRPDSVTFTDDLIEDLKRRDFTINSIAYNDTQGLIDPFHGIEDIEHRKIQCVGYAKERFNEDALRILRAIRFATQLNFSIDENTSKEIHNQYNTLKNISQERITSELNKMIIKPLFGQFLIEYQDVFNYIIPELKKTINFNQNNPYHIYDVFNHTAHALGYCYSVNENSDLIINLAVLFHDIAKPNCYSVDNKGIGHFYGHNEQGAELTNIIMQRMKYDNKTRYDVVQLIYYHTYPINNSFKSIRKLLNKIGEIQFRRLIALRRADIFAQNPAFLAERMVKLLSIEEKLNKIIETQQCVTLKQLNINGNDLIEAGIKQGKQIGNILNYLLDKVMLEEIKNNKEDLLQEVYKIRGGNVL